MKEVRIYTGAHLLLYEDKKRQFGIVDAWSDLSDWATVVRLSFGKQLQDKLQANDEGVTIQLDLSEAAVLLEQLNTVIERIKHLVILSKKEKLVDNAYYPKTNNEK